MTSVPDTEVRIFFGSDATGDGLFILDDPVRGLLDSVYELGGDSGTDITGTLNAYNFERGRDGLIFDSIDPGSGALTMNNEDRRYDPLHAAGPYFGQVRPAKPVTIDVLGVRVFTGEVSDWDIDYQVSGRGVAQASIEDPLAFIGRQRFLEWTTTGSQAAGARLTTILNRGEVGWSGGARDLDTGVSTLQSDLVTYGSNVLNYCQLVAQSDLGLFFASRDGLLTFRDRHATIGAATSVTFGTGGIPFVGMALTFGSEVFYTAVSVDREGGIAQTVVSSLATTDGYRPLALSGLLQDSDSQALDMATYLANVYATGDGYVSQIVVNLHDTTNLTTANIIAICELDIGDVVDFVHTPMGVGSAIDQSLVVQGIRHDRDPETHVVTVSTAPLEQQNPFILDNAVLGALDGVGLLTF